MGYEEPLDLLARLKVGREEFCQRLLTSLIVGGAYPRWDSRNRPSPSGVSYLQLLDEASFGSSGSPAEVFVDELLLAARTEDERGGSPDQAALWPDRVWLIELKTEPGSHRLDQLPSYFTLARHHFPSARVDVTYLTPPIDVASPAVTPPDRYAHVAWPVVADLVGRVWGTSDDRMERRLVEVLQRTVEQMETPAPGWRERLTAVESVPASATPEEQVPPPATDSVRDQAPDPSVPGETDPPASLDPVEAGLALATATAADGRQRAVPADAGSLEDLLELRLALREGIAALPDDAPERHVLPWLWRADSSTGTALSETAARTGFEVRLSRYRRAVV